VSTDAAPGSNTRTRARLTTTQQAINLLRPDRRNDLPVI
jgi:hypothetical protein